MKLLILNKMLLLFFVPLMIVACKNEKTDSSLDIESRRANEDSATITMAKILKEAHGKIDPMKVSYHLNTKRAEYLKNKVTNSKDIQEQVVNRGLYANELLQAGNTTSAILEFESLITELKQYKANPDYIYSLRGLLALAYMRLGEQDNCIGQNNSESCILPIQDNGVYKLRNGSETAISIYEAMLSERPNDMETIWLLNIAYMTLGEYPQNVPSKWKIPENAFKSKEDFSPFKNIGNKLNLNETSLAGGCSIEDFNNDGFLDIMATSWGVNDPIKLFNNNGDGTFTNVSDNLNLDGITGGLNITHADYNNDGFIDVLILRGGWFMTEGNIPNSLLKNNGDGSFTDVTIEAGLFSQFPTQTATWSDFNNDGWLDLFIGNESVPLENKFNPCELYINQKGQFVNVTDKAGLKNIKGVVKGVTSGDVNNDNLNDIYVSIMGGYNLLMLNQGQGENSIPKFADVTQQAGVNLPITSFPTWMWDYNNDGFLDIFVGSYDLQDINVAGVMSNYFINKGENSSKIVVYKNNGNGTFTDASSSLGLNEPAFVMGSNFGDIDNDGFLDFYLGTGAPNYKSIVPNKLYKNSQGNKFDDVTYSARVGHIQKGHGVSFGDLDNDGDQDIFHVLGGAYEGDIFNNVLFENTTDYSNNFITISLIGTKSNRNAIGAKLKIITTDNNGKENTIYRNVSTGGSFGASSLQQEIGIGKATKIKMLSILWPNSSNSITYYEDIEPNQFIKITEGQKEFEIINKKPFKF